jgi:nucleoside-diphosphate kinase
MVKPDAYTNLGKILATVHQQGFLVSKLKMARLSVNDCHELYGEHKGKPFFQGLIDFVTSDVVVGMELVSENAI